MIALFLVLLRLARDHLSAKPQRSLGWLNLESRCPGKGLVVNKHVKRVAIGAIAIGVMVGGSLAVFYGFFYIPHFSVVQDGILYRSGQPDMRDLKRLREVYGVRMLVNLRRMDEQDGSKGLSLPEERAETERLGMKFVHMPMDSDEAVDSQDVRRWLEIVANEDNWPILVHCKRGVDRTGLLAAVYRTKIQGWEPSRALDEAVAERLDPDRNPHLKAYILACRANTTAPTTVSTPAPLIQHAVD